MRISGLVISLLSVTATVLGATLSRRAAITPNVNGNAIQVNPGQGGTYPRLTTLHDGSILAVVTAFSGANHILTVTRSTDGGNSFQAWGTVATATNDLDNGNLVQLPNGDIVCTFRNNDRNANGVYTFYRITACVSHDNGRTWSFLSQVDQRTANGVNGLWEPFGRVARSGALQIYYAAENNGGDQDILMRSSTNGGATWSGVTTVAGATTAGRDGMPGCADFNANGQNKVMCVFETTEGLGRFSVKSVVSNDDGVTWGERAQVYVATGSNNNAGAPQIIATTGGALVVSFMTDEDTSLHQWVNGADMKIVTSALSDPASWGRKTTVSGVQSNWPGMLAKTDGGALGCADNGGAVCHQINFS
ncbi:hypothetical protein D9756_009219 [Leucocoprinus leucothites]|uniref:Glycoside hydrolase family 93 protein n=1 Tax=Leucocoprinus leucothites TaxID=201217 RepID=A0A8H5CY67_9AGAR|nr:hypothetical protein D9756_009219 [Leucoagaricus leucothites]